jgi:peptidoglycan/xylan/chitin deacetylase (PgdA/CDA1 family)
MIFQIKKIIKKTLYETLAWEPILRYWRRKNLQQSIVVLMYHELAEDADNIEAWTVVSKNNFLMQMEYLQSKFNILSLADAFKHMEDPQSFLKPAAVITFDDGYAGNKRTLLPIIKSINIPVTIFVSTRAVQEQIVYWYDKLINALPGDEIITISLKHIALNDYCINKFNGQENWSEIERLLTDLKTLQPIIREAVVDDILIQTHACKSHAANMAPLTIKDVQELADCPLVTIGAHSHCHNILTQLNEHDVKNSVQMSKQLLESWIRRPVHYFSYPNGNYNTTVINSIKEAGLQCGLTTDPRPWKKAESNFTIPRLGIGKYDSLSFFKVKVSGGTI